MESQWQRPIKLTPLSRSQGSPVESRWVYSVWRQSVVTLSLVLYLLFLAQNRTLFLINYAREICFVSMLTRPPLYQCRRQHIYKPISKIPGGKGTRSPYPYAGVGQGVQGDSNDTKSCPDNHKILEPRCLITRRGGCSRNWVGQHFVYARADGAARKEDVIAKIIDERVVQIGSRSRQRAPPSRVQCGRPGSAAHARRMKVLSCVYGKTYQPSRAV
ncbi:hypothetical protein BOTBODRAFT_445955 [Botryobasidium botryosum FD-172 SS1]|uniref:Uncharacterized protein n=1 Tax=Botryobasidium botryosum (strain FD-172 SS1) TaxID=930990 RepID=A0A067M7K7_BOTB1|nr:hypothetical protein BOTBODRAFT_445955 [Botryobasidium botryosum FD-172 SS1]